MLRADEVSFCKEVFDFKLKTIFGASVKDGMIIPTLHRPHWVTLQRAQVEIISVKSRQGGITCGAIDEPRKSSKAIDESVIINFRDKNVVIARFRNKNVYQ